MHKTPDAASANERAGRLRRWNPFLRFPIVSLLLLLALCLPLVLKLSQFHFSSELRWLLDGDQRNLASYEKVRQILSGVEAILVSVECPEVFSIEGISAIQRISEAFERQPGVRDVKSLTHSSKPVRRGLTFEMVPLIPPNPSPTQLADLKAFCLQHPLIRDVMVAKDARHSLITITYQAEHFAPGPVGSWRAEIERVLAPFRQEGLRFALLGVPLIEEEIRKSLQTDLKRIVPAAVIFLVGITGWTFRSWRILGLILTNQLAALMILPGAILSLGFTINVFSVMSLPLVAGVHLTLLAHLFAAVQARCRTGSSASVAVEEGAADVLRSSLFAAITTIIGLLSLTLSDVRQMREFGMVSALGVALVFWMTFGPGLAMAKLAARWGSPGSFQSKQPSRLPDRWPEWLAAVSSRHRRGLGAGAILILAFAVWGLFQLRTDIRAVEFLNPNSPTRLALQQLDAVYGGINVVQIEIDSGRPGGVNDVSFLRYVEKVHQLAAAQHEISGVYSYAQLLAMIHQIWEGGRADAQKLPDNPLIIQLFVFALRAGNFPFLTALADPEGRTAYVVVRTRDMPARDYLTLLDRIAAHADSIKPDGITVSAALGIHTVLEADRRILRSQLQSAGSTLLVIGAVLAVLWRSIKLSAASLLTNLVPVAFVLAVAAIVGIPLNSITAMVAAVALGIAVDDSIHLITAWQEAAVSGSSHPLEDAFRAKLQPIIFTSVILIALFGVFALSSFPPVVHFGLLSATAFAAALISVLIFLPALDSLKSDF